MKRALLAVLVGLLLVAATVSCGVPTRDRADRADPEDVPFRLLDAEAVDDVGTRSGTPVDTYVYDATTQRLVRVAATAENGSLDTVLRLLQRPASGADVPVGNPLGGIEVVQSAEVSRGRATVDLSEGFVDLSGTDQLVALAELVYTATGRPGVGQVSFTLEGEPVGVPRGDGSLTSEPLTRSDFAELAPVD